MKTKDFTKLVIWATNFQRVTCPWNLLIESKATDENMCGASEDGESIAHNAQEHFWLRRQFPAI